MKPGVVQITNPNISTRNTNTDFRFYISPLQKLQDSQGAPDAAHNEAIFINDIFEVESRLILRRALNTIRESP